MKVALTFALLAGSAVSLFANGGGYSSGGVAETGTITGFTPSGTEAVEMVEETLDVALGSRQATVKVDYQLRNPGDKPARVRFGFPVEELDPEDLNEDSSVVEGEKSSAKKKLEYCRDYQVEFHGKAVKAEFEAEPEADLSRPERKGIRGWLVSTIEVPAGATVPLKIRYSADYLVDEVYVSDDERHEPKVFVYRLSTGGVWAGPIVKGTVTVRPDGISAGDIRVLAPAGRFAKEGDDWKWAFENLEPKLADDLRIEASPSVRVFGYRTAEEGANPVDFIEIGDRWFVRHQNFSKMTASSTLPPGNGKTYAAENVADGDWETVWCEGGKGTGPGEWLEATLEVPKPLTQVTIQGGYQADEGLFKRNARPKKVELILNGEHRISADLPDAIEAVEIPVVGYTKPVETVRMVIKEVYPGEKWPDCVVTRLAVTTSLSKKPSVSPAR